MLVLGPDGHPTDSYFNYDPPWTGENAGHNVLFDMGITLGEFIIANCPKLRWDFDPVSAILPRTAKRRKRDSGSSFQRPELTGFDDPASGAIPLHDVYMFARQMIDNLITFEGVNGFNSCPKEMRKNIREQLINDFNIAIRYYHSGDPYQLRGQIGHDEYLKFIDTEDDGDE